LPPERSTIPFTDFFNLEGLAFLVLTTGLLALVKGLCALLIKETGLGLLVINNTTNCK